MIVFGVGLLIIISITLWIIWWPYLRRHRLQPVGLQTADLQTTDSGREQTNIAIYQQQIASLPSQFSDRENLILQQLNDELALSLLQDVGSETQPVSADRYKYSLWLPLTMSLMVVLLPLVGYLQFNSYSAAVDYSVNGQHDPFSGMESQDINDLQVAELQQRIRLNPQDSQAWFSLGQYYLFSDRFEQALFTIDKAMAIEGESANLLAAKATVLYYLDGQKIMPQTQALIDRSLSIDPLQVTALMLQASDHFYHARYQQAIDIWQQLLDSDNPQIDRVSLIERITMARMIR